MEKSLESSVPVDDIKSPEKIDYSDDTPAFPEAEKHLALAYNTVVSTLKNMENAVAKITKKQTEGETLTDDEEKALSDYRHFKHTMPISGGFFTRAMLGSAIILTEFFIQMADNVSRPIIEAELEELKKINEKVGTDDKGIAPPPFDQKTF